MPRKKSDPLAPVLGFHPYRADFRLPDRVIESGWRVFDSPEGKAEHPGAAAMLKIPGISVVSLHGHEIAVLREPERSWEELTPALQAVLREHFLGKPPFVPQEPVDGSADADAAA